MYRKMIGGKIHRATVTEADLHYVGSITIDEVLLEASGIQEGEFVQIVDITNGSRIETYTILGEPGSGVIGINGAAAHLISPGDMVIIMSAVRLSEDELEMHSPKVVHVDEANRIIDLHTDPSIPNTNTGEERSLNQKTKPGITA